MTREIWKPIALVVIAITLIGWGLRFDPAHPRCGSITMTPQMVCEVSGKGLPQERTYEQMAADARAWRIGAPIAGGVIAVGGAVWLVLLLRRRPGPPAPARPWSEDTGPRSPVTPVRH